MSNLRHSFHPRSTSQNVQLPRYAGHEVLGLHGHCKESLGARGKRTCGGCTLAKRPFENGISGFRCIEEDSNASHASILSQTSNLTDDFIDLHVQRIRAAWHSVSEAKVCLRATSAGKGRAASGFARNLPCAKWLRGISYKNLV